MVDVAQASLHDDYEMSSMAASTSIRTNDSAAPAYQLEPQDGANVQELPAVDGGKKAWTFCVSAFVLETMVWGFGFRYIAVQSIGRTN